LADRHSSSATWIIGVRNAVRWQTACGFIAACVVGFEFGLIPGLSAAYGVMLSLLNGLWLTKRLERVQTMDSPGGQRSLYAGAAILFIGFLVALILAIVLGLHLLAVAGGLLLAQIAMFVYAAGRARGELIGRD